MNACHLGAINRQVSGLNRVAASFARKLMQIGVRAVIAAGWAVDDAAAEAFAKTLYEQLFDGYELGDAVQNARLAAHDVAPEALTWGAYQCYGDPGFRIAARVSRATTNSSLTVAELRRRIRQAAGMVSDHTSSIAALRHQIGEVADNASEPGWEKSLETVLASLEDDPVLKTAGGRVRADVAADLGAAWAELGRFDKAADHLERAVRAGGSDVPIRAIERLANVLVRYATEVTDPVLRRQYTRRARHYLRVLNALGATGEREALWGSYLKKRATMTESDRWRTFFVTRSAARYAAAQALEPNDYHDLAARQLGAIAAARLVQTVTPAAVASGGPAAGANGADGADASRATGRAVGGHGREHTGGASPGAGGLLESQRDRRPPPDRVARATPARQARRGVDHRRGARLRKRLPPALQRGQPPVGDRPPDRRGDARAGARAEHDARHTAARRRRDHGGVVAHVGLSAPGAAQVLPVARRR